MKKNLIFFLGTKAQFIKTIPIINAVDTRKYKVFLYDTCQHKNLSEREIEKINNEIAYVKISNNLLAADSLKNIVSWFIKTFILLFSKKYKISETETSLCFVHGNTLSTILGIVWCKIHKIKLIHIEGGYRSFNWLKPFPEEIIRYWTSKFSDLVVCFDNESNKNLKNMNIRGSILQVSRNTVYESIALTNLEQPFQNKLLVSIHRNENVYNRKILEDTVYFLIYLNKNYFEHVVWYMHPQTKKILLRTNLLNKLEKEKIITLNLTSHDNFINEISTSSCVFTDGESIIEECSIIGTPTYALINKLENSSSKRKNIFVSEYKHYENLEFFNKIENYRSNYEEPILSVLPSFEIIKNIEKYFFSTN